MLSEIGLASPTYDVLIGMMILSEVAALFQPTT